VLCISSEQRQEDDLRMSHNRTVVSVLLTMSVFFVFMNKKGIDQLMQLVWLIPDIP
jgi:hypothetical protein